MDAENGLMLLDQDQAVVIGFPRARAVRSPPRSRMRRNSLTYSGRARDWSRRPGGNRKTRNRLRLPEALVEGSGVDFLLLVVHGLEAKAAAFTLALMSLETKKTV
jgi:hypothetical protein